MENDEERILNFVESASCTVEQHANWGKGVLEGAERKTQQVQDFLSR